MQNLLPYSISSKTVTVTSYTDATVSLKQTTKLELYDSNGKSIILPPSCWRLWLLLEDHWLKKKNKIVQN